MANLNAGPEVIGGLKRKGPAKRGRKNPTKRPHWGLKQYATSGVLLMAGLSAMLNGYANALHAAVPTAGWALGVIVPGIILILGKVAALASKRGHRALAAVTAASAIGLLALSVWHCAVSISLLSGSPVGLALPMAIAIDVGFCCCEYALIVE